MPNKITAGCSDPPSCTNRGATSSMFTVMFTVQTFSCITLLRRVPLCVHLACAGERGVPPGSGRGRGTTHYEPTKLSADYVETP